MAQENIGTETTHKTEKEKTTRGLDETNHKGYRQKKKRKTGNGEVERLIMVANIANKYLFCRK